MSKPLSDDEIDHRRSILVACAITLLEENGADGLTLRKLAEAAGVSRQTPYLYFKDKSDLLDAIRIAGLIRLTQATTAAVNESENDGYIEQLRVAGEAYVRFGLDHPTLYRMIYKPTRAEETVSSELQRALDANSLVTAAPMKAAFDDGILVMPPERLNQVFWAALHGLISLRNEGLIGDDETFVQTLEDLENILATGFLKVSDKAQALS